MALGAPSCRETYQGDPALDGLLAKAKGLRLAEPTVAGVRDLLRGVLAAPESLDPDSWMSLVASDPSPALAAQLRALEAEMIAQGAAGDGIADDPTPLAQRLANLRATLKAVGADGFIVPRADEHHGEYVPLAARRLTWISNFTGSAGLALILPETAALFVDGRYTLQARTEVDPALFHVHHQTARPAQEWLAANLKPGQVIGYDPWLHTVEEIARFREAAEKVGGKLLALTANPIDQVWTRRPPPPLAPVVPLDTGFTGRMAADKRATLGAALAAAGIDAAVLSLPDSIAWLLNIRGGDVGYSPLPLSFAILHKDGAVTWFVDRRKVTPGLPAHLGNEVCIEDRDAFGAALDLLGREGRRVQADPSTAPAWVFDRLKAAGATIARAADPTLDPKACKNEVELAGMRAAHKRDGASLSRFLAWFANEAPLGNLTETAVAERLEAIRREGEHFRGLSFPTIAGAGPDGAIVHYHATAATDRRIEPGMVFLLDSGAQYLDGTTDVTRTLFVAGGASPSDEAKAAFTRVLKGHIALAMAHFPSGTTGSQLDILARMPLWQAGLDYDHGTGHGVGHYLNVHEGPQRISKMPNREALKPGMVVSNEPGYYKAGAFGIRIENLVAVREASKNGGGANAAGLGSGAAAPVSADGQPMLEFETITLVPIDRQLIDPALLTAEEIQWLDSYHARVHEVISPLVDLETAAWLAEATRALGS
jgi:Xaa-Pro aminopeptidase